MKKLLLIAFAIISLSACSSNETDPEKELAILADYRATKLASVVPLKMGPMTLMQAVSKKEVVRLVFINEAGNNARTRTVIDSSINTYCHNEEVRAVLDKGVKYQYIIRNARGQVQNDITVDSQMCLDMGIESKEQEE